MINCPNCGAGNKPGSTLCRMCATSLEGVVEAPVTRAQDVHSNPLAVASSNREVREEEKTSVEQEGIICPDCNASNDAGWSFCQQCGKKLPKYEPPLPPPHPELEVKTPADLTTNPEQEAVTEPSLGQAMKTIDEKASVQQSFKTVPEKRPVIEPDIHKEKPFAAPQTVVAQAPISAKPVDSPPDDPEGISTVTLDPSPQEERAPVPPPAAAEPKPPAPPPVHEKQDVPLPSAGEPKPPAPSPVKQPSPMAGMSGVLCTQCGQSNAVGAAFCASCGAPVTFGKTMVMSSLLAPTQGRLHLVMEGGQPGETYELGDETVIGRNNGEITFPHDGFMSGRHARIARLGGSFVLTDEGSRNGTFVKIKGDVELKPGDMILVGKQLFRFEV